MAAKAALTAIHNRCDFWNGMQIAGDRQPKHGKQSDYPQLWGTRRVGPDLARESGVRSPDWQLTHLYNPRLIVADSVMPGYPWLFRQSANAPTQEGQDLLAYVQSLGHARQISGYDSHNLMASMGDASAMSSMFSHSGSSVAHANAPRQDQSSPLWTLASDTGEYQRDVSHGAAVLQSNCASCHGAEGKGNGRAAETLLPRPRNLTAVRATPEQLSTILWNGVAGASMPAWRDLPEHDLRSLVAFLTSIGTSPETVASNGPDDGAKKLFTENCISCHGSEGAGDGVAARALAPRPTNFQAEQPSEEYARKALREGVPGTAMPNWREKLSEDERRQLAAYVRSLFGARNTGEVR